MKTETAQARSVTDAPKMIHGVKVWPLTMGCLKWLNDRKNKVITQKAPDDFSLAEFCFAFTKQPEDLQSFRGASATKSIDSFLLCSRPSTLTGLFNYGVEQLVIHIKTQSQIKKPRAAKGRSNPTKQTRARSR